ncbi:hypothetical protein PTKIN_Ptkin08bG0066900 [Pterospermum kingtungense]
MLRYHDLTIKILFSKSTGMANSNLAELQAMWEAFILFSASQWAQSHKLVIYREILTML